MSIQIHRTFTCDNCGASCYMPSGLTPPGWESEVEGDLCTTCVVAADAAEVGE